jgi:Actinobacteria/chloroflexi VLRF1 release factor
VKRPASGGGRWVEVAPERLAGWLERFAVRHGTSITSVTAELTGSGSGAEAVTYVSRDGAVAECHVPFPPLETGRQAASQAQGSSRREPDPAGLAQAGLDPAGLDPAGLAPAGLAPAGLAQQIAAHAARDRTVGVLLVRLGGYAAGVFAGSPPRLLASKTGSRLVHGRSAAGGQSQQRFARRREKQAAEALAAAAGAAAAVFAPYRDRLDAVVLGGDRRAMDSITDDPRLSSALRPYLGRAVDRFLTVPDPRRNVLEDSPRLFRAVRIRLVEPPAEPPDQDRGR